MREHKAFVDWKGSVHAREGVACDACHGGDRSEPLYADAHRGILGASDPRSPIHAYTIPATCGECHQPQLKEFQRSRHFLLLRTDERELRAPTCVTCHGAMHTTALSPAAVADQCRLCHNSESRLLPHIPGEAHATLSLIFYAQTTIQWSEEFLAAARKQGHDVSKATDALKEAEVRFRYSKIKWHSFNFPEILRMVDGAYEAAKRAKELAAREVRRVEKEE